MLGNRDRKTFSSLLKFRPMNRKANITPLWDSMTQGTYRTGKRKIKKAERKQMKKIRQAIRLKELEMMESLKD